MRRSFIPPYDYQNIRDYLVYHFGHDADLKKVLQRATREDGSIAWVMINGHQWILRMEKKYCRPEHQFCNIWKDDLLAKQSTVAMKHLAI